MVSYSLENEARQWILEKIVECGEASGVPIDHLKEGWIEVIEFAQAREY